MFVKPPGPRHTATEDVDGLTISIPVKRNVFLFAFLSFWLCGWVIGEIMAPIGLFNEVKKDPAAAAFLIVWLCGWTLGGAFAICIWLWLLRGREIVTLSPEALAVRHDVFGLGRTMQFDAAEIRELRLATATFNPFDLRAGLAIWGIGGGMLAFDYGYKTYRFGAGVDEAEARVILQRVRQRLPASATPQSTVAPA